MPAIFDSFDPPTVYAAIGAVPTSTTVITADTIRLLTLYLSNVGATNRTVTITNSAGVEIVKTLVPALTPMPALTFAMMRCVGLKWIADGAGVNGQVEGFPDV